MGGPSFENLDLACAKAGKGIVDKLSEDSKAGPKLFKEIENLIRDAISVLEEQGVYALFLFLKTKTQSKKPGDLVSRELHIFLKNVPQKDPLLCDDNDLFDSLQKLAEDLDKLLLASNLLRQTLIYAFYHARLRTKEVASS